MTTPTLAPIQSLPLGASRLPGGEWAFVLWAPLLERVIIHLPVAHNTGQQNAGKEDRLIDMQKDALGYHVAVADGLSADARYFYRLPDGRDLPDPASRFQPDGVHGPSQVVDTSQFLWTDRNWHGIALEKSIFYELHVGAYTRAGTFESLIEHLPQLAALGVTMIELMPVAQFPGSRNWGYDGVFPYAPQNTYGGPQGLHKFVDAAHRHGLAVALDVVYNHLGPEGNYLGQYGPYFTTKYQTPWGQAINYDGPHSDHVRRFFIDNALYWPEEYHFDALRLDAVHGIFDLSALHLLAELKSSAEKLALRLGRKIQIIAESDLNDSRMILPQNVGGYGLDAQWSDDFHHSVHSLLTGEKNGYYEDFGQLSHLAGAMRDGWYYRGQYSQHRQRKHGNSPEGISSSHFVVCSQNHDQIGNRAAGERLTALVDFEGLKLAAGITLLSPFVPLLFMGEEYGEIAPFQYFISHLDPQLVEAVRRGRREEFSAFGWQQGVPDPQDESTFRRSELQHALKTQEPHANLWRFYRQLIELRKRENLGGGGAGWRQWEDTGLALMLIRRDTPDRMAAVFNFSTEVVILELPKESGSWKITMSSADTQWKGPGQPPLFEKPFRVSLHPHSFVVLQESLSQ